MEELLKKVEELLKAIKDNTDDNLDLQIQYIADELDDLELFVYNFYEGK